MKRENKHQKTGFTLVEILTVIAVIAILLGFLIPALSSVEKTALKVKQRAQFHSIEVALEGFSTDMGDYPPSAWNTVAYGRYSASQRLAEALVGQDGFGFHQDSKFLGNGTDGTATVPGNSLYDPSLTLNERKGPYLELESANAVKLSDLYGTSIVGGAGQLVDTYVLADVYKITKNAATGKLTGSPILYYRANRDRIQHDGSLTFDMASSNTYNVYDSLGTILIKGIAKLVPLTTKTGSHPLDSASGRLLFYEQIKNPNFPGDSTYPASGTPPRPYRADSFILQSAGPDGLYGTTDDVFNFDPEN